MYCLKCRVYYVIQAEYIQVWPNFRLDCDKLARVLAIVIIIFSELKATAVRLMSLHAYLAGCLALLAVEITFRHTK